MSKLRRHRAAGVLICMCVALSAGGVQVSQSATASVEAADHVVAPGHPVREATGTPASVVRSVSRPSPAGPALQSVVHVLAVGGRQRSYEMIRPRLRSAVPLPTIVLLHGRNMTPEAMARVSGFDRSGRPAVLVYPIGLGASWNAGTCCGPAQAANVDDVTYLERVVAQVLATQPDTTRHEVYLAGFSNGGRMVFRMACEAPGLFRAFAAVEAVSVFPCAHPVPVRLLEIASTGDPLLAGAQPTVNQLMSTWRNAGGCTAQATTVAYGALHLQSWSGCRQSAAVELAVLNGGGHRWPVDAGPLIWKFFASA
jgi:polyhydroxybutyrate depolymerase